MIKLSTIIESTQHGFLKNVLEGAGVTLLTAGGSMLALKEMIAHLQSYQSSLSGFALSLMHVLGLDVFMSLILGAMVAKHYQDSAKLVLGRKK